jgi:uncharacterized membrane protein YdcZ (DUF606 family)
MSFFAALLHLLNFYAPALGVALILSTLAKQLWHQPLQATPWWRLVIPSSAVGVLVLTLGLLWAQRDGRVSTYACMLIGQSFGLSWQMLRNSKP